MPEPGDIRWEGLSHEEIWRMVQEGDPVAAALAGTVLEVEDVAAVLADKELQDLASSAREFYE